MYAGRQPYPARVCHRPGVERIKNSVTLAEAGVRASASHLGSERQGPLLRNAGRHPEPTRQPREVCRSGELRRSQEREGALPFSTLQVQPELGQHAHQPGLAQA
eukprot:scaffold109093_cov33-Phaeocystis_antarctica.AAC.2